MSFGSTIKNILSPVWQHIETVFPASVQFVISFFQYAIQYMLQNGGFIVTEAAEVAVKDASNTSLTNAQKFSQAFTDVVAVVEKNGLTVGETAIKLALYSALAKYKILNPDASTAALSGTESALTATQILAGGNAATPPPQLPPAPPQVPPAAALGQIVNTAV